MTADFDADHFLKWLEGQTTGTGWQFSFGLVAFSWNGRNFACCILLQWLQDVESSDPSGAASSPHLWCLCRHQVLTAWWTGWRPRNMRENANWRTSTAGCVPACTPGASQPLPEKAWALSCHVQRRQKIGSQVVMNTLFFAGPELWAEGNQRVVAWRGASEWRASASRRKSQVRALNSDYAQISAKTMAWWIQIR